MTVAARGSKFQARVKEPSGGKYHRVTFDTLEAAEFWERKAQEAIKDGYLSLILTTRGLLLLDR